MALKKASSPASSTSKDGSSGTEIVMGVFILEMSNSHWQRSYMVTDLDAKRISYSVPHCRGENFALRNAGCSSQR